MRSKRQLPDPGKSREITITIRYNPNEKPISMEEHILDKLKNRELFVYELFQTFNAYRKDIGKKPGKYTSFRAIISTLKKKKYIESITPNRSDFDPSAYRITDTGLGRLQAIWDNNRG
jgi:hypothetical protein